MGLMQRASLNDLAPVLPKRQNMSGTLNQIERYTHFKSIPITLMQQTSGHNLILLQIFFQFNSRIPSQLLPLYAIERLHPVNHTTQLVHDGTQSRLRRVPKLAKLHKILRVFLRPLAVRILHLIRRQHAQRIRLVLLLDVLVLPEHARLDGSTLDSLAYPHDSKLVSTKYDPSNRWNT